MNKLDTNKRAQILHCLCEGNSIRATARLTDAAINTVVKLVCEAGKACSDYQDKVFRKLKCRLLQTDEAHVASAVRASAATGMPGKSSGLSLPIQNARNKRHAHFAAPSEHSYTDQCSQPRVIGNGNHTSNRRSD